MRTWLIPNHAGAMYTVGKCLPADKWTNPRRWTEQSGGRVSSMDLYRLARSRDRNQDGGGYGG